MNRDDIIRMAQEAGDAEGMSEFVFHPVIERFANLVAASEREACAKMCEEEMTDEIEDEAYYICKDLALRIRARGQE